MNCPSCAGPNERSAKYCIHCGSPLQRKAEKTHSPHYYERSEVTIQPPPAEPRHAQSAPAEDGGGCWITLLSFFFPLVGLVLWLVWAGEKPRSSRAARNGMFAALAVYIALVILSIIITSFLAFRL